MENKKHIDFFGYIEGYYGKLLKWHERRRIVKKLSKNNMNTYFYAPKEDVYHRINWRIEYPKDWYKKFQKFCDFSNDLSINIIVGLSPGIDFNFEEFENQKNFSKNSDYSILLRKAKSLTRNNSCYLALLLDDIPENFIERYNCTLSEGKLHALLVNKLSEDLNQKIFFVPKIYANELIKRNDKYLEELVKNINKDIFVFYCGENIVNQNYSKKSFKKISDIKCENIIIWDNLYANDYCPRKVFLGPWKGRNSSHNILVNMTGMVEVDLLLIEIISISINNYDLNNIWVTLINRNKLPYQLLNVLRYFDYPYFSDNSNFNYKNDISEIFISLEYLLWKWKSPLSRQLYPYFLGLKQDLQIITNQLTSERVLKTQTTPLSIFLNNIGEKYE